MPRMQQVPGTLDMQGRTQMVIDHHFDESRPDKPLWLLIPGGLIALTALSLGGLVGYRGWMAQTLDITTAEYLVAGLAAVFIAGTFTFSYGYELYHLGKAIRLTLIIVLLMVLAVLMVVVLVMVASALLKDSSFRGSRSSRSGPPILPALIAASSGSGGDYRGSGGYYRNRGPSPFAGAVYTPEAPEESFVPPAASEEALPGPPADMPPPSWLPSDAAPAAGAGGAPTTATLPAIPVAAAVTLPPIICPSCGLSYVPIAGKPPICPSCGAGFAMAPEG